MDVDLSLSKADRITVGESHATHALLFTGVALDRDGRPKSFRVESFGEKNFLTMSCQWFCEFVFQVAIDKKFLSEKILKVFEQEPKTLSAWDPMGSLVL